MVRPGRDRLTGTVEVDIRGLEENVPGRQTEKRALIAVACEEDGEGIGRIRMRRISDASADSFRTVIEEAVAPGSLLHMDGFLSYDPLEKRAYRHRITFLKGRKESAAELLLDDFTFRFNRRTSRHRGKLFYRVVQQAVAVDRAPYASLVKHVRPGKRRRRRHKI